jgi:diacylglycerol kinase
MSKLLRLFRSARPPRTAKSFKYAFQGLFHALINEPNFRIQIIIAVIAVFLGFHFGITNTEWSLLILSMGALLSAEMTNTVVEELLDQLIKEYHEGARIIKDLSAGFVLVTSLATLLILILIFGHRIAEVL